MEFAFKFEFSNDFVKDFDASKYMVLQNFLKNAKEFTCVANELTSINQNQTITLPNLKKNLLKLLINKINYFC